MILSNTVGTVSYAEDKWADRFGDLILHAIRCHAELPALVEGDVTLSYRQLGDKIRHALSLFRECGVRSGDVVAQLASNSMELYATMAAAYIGGFCSLTLHALGGAEDQAWILADSGARLLISDAAHADRAALLCESSEGRLKGFLHDASAPLPCFWTGASGIEPLPLEAEGSAEDIVRLAYTGGTTGRPKGVMLSNRALVTNTRLACEGVDWPARVRFLCPAPISHGAGSIIVPTLLGGGTVILQRSFSVPVFLEELKSRQATLTWLVPTMIIALLDHPALAKADTSSLETLIYSGSPMAPAHIRKAMERFGPILFQCYGQSEAPNTILALNRSEHILEDEIRLASAGRPFRGLEVTIRDDAGQDVLLGEAGEIWVRGPLLMSGYWRQPEATLAAMSDGWLRTGDIGRVDSLGFYYIIDRKKDMVITGGFNVYPKEVEDVIARHPAVAQVAVFGSPDPKWGEAVKAVVVLKPNAAAITNDLIDLVRATKGPIQVPKAIFFADSIPTTPLGKPDKKRLRQMY